MGPAIKMSHSLIKSNHSFVTFLDGLLGAQNGSQSGEVTLLPIDGILDSLQKEKDKWDRMLDECDTVLQSLEKLTMERYFFFLTARVYREQSLLQARLNNADAPYILPHDKVKYNETYL